MTLERHVVGPLISLQLECVLHCPKRIPIIHIGELGYLDTLVLFQTILRLQADLDIVVWIMFRGERQCDVTYTHEVLPIDLLECIFHCLCREKASHIIAEWCSIHG